MNRAPKVSICIPTYHQAPYMRQAVESALSQEFDDFEVVISDDQSTDDVRSYLLSLNDGRLRIVRPRHHLSMAENWAFCVSQSHGTYVNVLSNDDVLYPSYGKKLSSILDAHPEVAFAYCGAELISEAGRSVGVERHVGGSFVRRGSDEIGRFIQGAGCVFPTVMIRRDCYEKVGGFGSWGIVGDWDLELRMLRTGGVAYLDEVLVKYRIWSTHERASRITLQLQEIVRLYETTVSDLVKSYPRGVGTAVIAAKRHLARSGAVGIGRLSGTPKFEEAARLVLMLDSSLSVRFLLQLHRHGLSWVLSGAMKTKLWLRQRVKALLYASRGD